MKDTIAAISTPLGVGAVSMIRISGSDCFYICDRIFKRPGFSFSAAAPNTINHGKIIDIDTKQTIDECLAAVFISPASFTGENSVEFYCHGGIQITNRVLEEIIKAGARLAEPGEFSKRAFLNAKLDLSQAEAIIDLINAKSDATLTVAIGQLEGKIKTKMNEIREKLVLVLSHILAYIDFPDEDVEYIDEAQVLSLISSAKSEIQSLIGTYNSGKAITHGIDCVIAGLVNAGKSSLMNSLSGDKTSIVTEIEGTTRDIVAKSVKIGDIILNLLDTAGIRESTEYIENIGIERARDTINKAELILLVIDASKHTTKEDKELFYSIKDKQLLLIANKTDLEQRFDKAFYEKYGKIIKISAKNQTGIEKLKKEIEKKLIDKNIDIRNDKIITNIRHFEALNGALKDLNSALEGLNDGFTFDIISIDIQSAIEKLGEITGQSVSDEVIDAIFRRFCLGK